MSDFAQALAKTLIHEGGFSDDPLDRGGRTNHGITQNTYDVYRKGKGLDVADVRDITDAEVADIYYNFYWKQAHCDQLISQPIAEKFFDLYVNMRPSSAIKVLQRACIDSGRVLIPDGALGPLTIQAANDCDPYNLLDALRDRARRYYMAIVQNDPSQEKFLKGWIARANS